MKSQVSRVHALIGGLLLFVALSASPAQAAGHRVGTLDMVMRAQMQQASQAILAEQRESLKAYASRLDNPAVNVGPIRIVETAVAGQENERPDPVMASVDASRDAAITLADDLLAKALRSPGVMGLSRYIALPALKLALDSAE